MEQANYLFKKGCFYSRDDLWEKYHPKQGNRPKGGNWDTGYVREDNDLLIFMNIGVPGRTGHDFENTYNEKDESITWFGKPDTHSNQPIFKKLLNGELTPHFFARWDNDNPNFKYLGVGGNFQFTDGNKLQDGRETIKLTLKIENLSQTIGGSDKNYNAESKIFSLEKHLEDFLVKNWSSTQLGKKYNIYEEGGIQVGQQFQTDTGPIDILTIRNDLKEFCVIELKKGRASDAVVGQIQRYMGYVKDEVAALDQKVKGTIIALENDIRIERALRVTQDIDFYKYKIDFSLEKPF